MKIMIGLLLIFVPIIANCTSSQHVLSATSKLKKTNHYQGIFLYSKKDKNVEQGYIGISLSPDNDGLFGTIVFSPMTLKDKKILFDQYSSAHDRIVSAPRNKASILLAKKHFADVYATRNVRNVLLNFPSISHNMTFIENIGTQQNELNIKLDKNIKYNSNKDTRVNRLDWIESRNFLINEHQFYADQVQLKVVKGDVNSLDFRGGCLSSKIKGKINNVSIFMTEKGKGSRIKKLKILELQFYDPVFHTFFVSEVNIKLRKNSILPLFKQHNFELVCTTTKGEVLNTQNTFTSTITEKQPYDEGRGY